MAGLGIGEALARCPELRLVPPDPEGVRVLWGKALDALEQVGAAVESDRAGVGWFELRGLLRIHGGDVGGVLAAARRSLRPTAAGAARLAAAPSRFAAYVAAIHTRPRRPPEVVSEKGMASFLSPLPVGLLRSRPELAGLPEALERLGIRTLGEYAALAPPLVAERFGHPGLLALDLACGRDTPLVPRRPPESVVEHLDLHEAVSGPQLERALELLVGRILARPERKGRGLRAVALSAPFVAGGTWRARVALRQATADPERIRLALWPRLAELPAPIESLAAAVEGFGPPAHDQPRLLAAGEDASAARRGRVSEAVRQARRSVGEGAAMTVMEIDPDSRFPERRAVLAPYREVPTGANGYVRGQDLRPPLAPRSSTR